MSRGQFPPAGGNWDGLAKSEHPVEQFVSDLEVGGELGHDLPAPEFAPPFKTERDLRAVITRAVAARENLRAEMIALQEEMDWLVYAAYGLLPEKSPVVAAVYDRRTDGAVAAVYDRRTDGADTAPLQEGEFPFRLWAKTDGDFAKAVALIPADCPTCQPAYARGASARQPSPRSAGRRLEAAGVEPASLANVPVATTCLVR